MFRSGVDPPAANMLRMVNKYNIFLRAKVAVVLKKMTFEFEYFHMRKTDGEWNQN